MQAAIPFLNGRVLDVGCGSGALANFVPEHRYFGIDMDSTSIELAKQTYPTHSFENTLSTSKKGFDTIVALAVIEHVKSPSEFLASLKPSLKNDANARIVCTTPNPALELPYSFGAKLGLFSSSANEEHETLLDRSALEQAGKGAGMEVEIYKRFLLGANQIVCYRIPPDC